MINAASHFFTADTRDEICLVLDCWQASQGAVLALLAEADQALLADLQNICSQRDMPLLGGIFPALIQDDDFVSHGLWLIHLPQLPSYALLENINAGDMSAAQKIVAAISDQASSASSTLFLMFDGQVPNISSILDELYLEWGDAFQYVGSNAGSESFLAMPCLFDNTRCIGNGVLCFTLPSSSDSALIHGYQAPEDLITATATEGNRIVAIDWQPAFEVYKRMVQQQFNVILNHDNFYQYAVHYPLGICLANHQTLVRIPVAIDDAEAIFCVGEIPPHALLTLLHAPQPHAMDTVQQLALSFPRRSSSQHLMLFYCAGRRMHLGETAAIELRELSRLTGAGLCGAVSLGEIGSIDHGSYPQFHNGAMVGVDWGGA